MITVAHVITDLEAGGAQSMLVKLLQQTDHSQFSVHVYSLLDPPGSFAPRVEALGIPLHAIGVTRRSPNPTRVFRLAARLRELRPDVVQTWMYHSDLAGGLAAKLASLRLPVLWNIRQSNFDPTYSRPRTVRLAKICAALSSYIPTRIICCSNVARQLHAAMGYDDSKIQVIPNGFDIIAFRRDLDARASVRAELGLPADTTLVGMVARIDPQKDHGTFVAAAAKLHAQLPNVRFVLCGSGVDTTNTELMQWIDQAGLRDVCYLLGERPDVPRITASLDIATLSSAYGEGFPNVLGEAMACEVPCVATEVGDSAHIVGHTGRVVPPRDPNAIAAAWLELLNAGDGGLRTLGQEARRRILENFTIPRVARAYEAAYRSVLDTPRGSQQALSGWV